MRWAECCRYCVQDKQCLLQDNNEVEECEDYEEAK
jgi:hypothetical protein